MQDMKNEQAQLQEKLYKKMQQEQNEYLEGIKKLPSEEILTKAYAISCRENFLYIVQEDDPLSLEQLQVLLELPHPLAKLYDDWLNLDVSELDLLRGSIQSTLQGILERKAEEKYRNPNTPVYQKNYWQACACGERIEWEANRTQNRQCMDSFKRHAEWAHAEKNLPAFLKQWQALYGTERCQMLLACTINRKLHDGRLSPEVKKQAMQLEEAYHLQGQEYGEFICEVHSGILERSMRYLMEPEPIQQKNKNGQER